MDERLPVTKPWWRPRISLLTALLLTTIVGMGIVIAKLWREVGPLRADNKRLNEERGTLVIGDPTRLHAIGIPTRFAGEDRQSYRVYVPPGQTYMALVQVNDVPKTGLPKPLKFPEHAGILGNFQGRLYARLPAGEHVVSIRTTRRGRAADISLIVRFASPAISLDASANTTKDQWPTKVPETFKVFGDGVHATSTAADGAEPLVLVRRRIMGVSAESVNFSHKTPEPDLPLDGVMLWLEPTPK